MKSSQNNARRFWTSPGDSLNLAESRSECDETSIYNTDMNRIEGSDTHEDQPKTHTIVNLVNPISGYKELTVCAKRQLKPM